MVGNQKVEIIAGPCSIDKSNLSDVETIASTGLVKKVRFVPAKSRTNYPSFRGLDAEVLEHNMQAFALNSCDIITPPSVEYAREFREKFPNVGLAMEVMLPALQLSHYAKDSKHFGQGSLFIWSPSVDQLGWSKHLMAEYANNSGWDLGIKNGKWLGGTLAQAQSLDSALVTGIEKTWVGLSSWVQNNKKGRNILIHRGFDPGTDDRGYRNLPIHPIAIKTKQQTGLPMFFDPSHTLGPKLRDQIVEETIDTMQLRMPNGTFLYDGILIEVAGEHGVQTDAGQHISIQELEIIANAVSQTRGIVEP